MNSNTELLLYKCALCPYETVAGMDVFELHVDRVHFSAAAEKADNGDRSCPFCNFTTESTNSLYGHIHTWHDTSCCLCGYRVKNSRDFDSHSAEMEHAFTAENLIHICPDCHFKSQKSQDYWQHRYLEHSVQTSAVFAKKSAASAVFAKKSASLQVSKKNRLVGDKTKRLKRNICSSSGGGHKCPFCPYVSHIRSHVVRHVHGKHDKKCPYCSIKGDATFMQSHLRMAHNKRINKGLKTTVLFVCEECNISTRDAFQYWRHRLDKHAPELLQLEKCRDLQPVIVLPKVDKKVGNGSSNMLKNVGKGGWATDKMLKNVGKGGCGPAKPVDPSGKTATPSTFKPVDPSSCISPNEPVNATEKTGNPYFAKKTVKPVDSGNGEPVNPLHCAKKPVDPPYLAKKRSNPIDNAVHPLYSANKPVEMPYFAHKLVDPPYFAKKRVNPPDNANKPVDLLGNARTPDTNCKLVNPLVCARKPVNPLAEEHNKQVDPLEEPVNLHNHAGKKLEKPVNPIRNDDKPVNPIFKKPVNSLIFEEKPVDLKTKEKTCPYCDFGSHSMWKVFEHVHTSHDRVCPQCDFIVESSEALANHVLDIHRHWNIPENFQCSVPMCQGGQAYDNLEDFWYHRLDMHPHTILRVQVVEPGETAAAPNAGQSHP